MDDLIVDGDILLLEGFDFDHSKLLIGGLINVPEVQVLQIFIDHPVRIVWHCGQHDHRWRFMARLCHYFSERD